MMPPAGCGMDMGMMPQGDARNGHGCDLRGMPGMDMGMMPPGRMPGMDMGMMPPPAGCRNGHGYDASRQVQWNGYGWDASGGMPGMDGYDASGVECMGMPRNGYGYDASGGCPVDMGMMPPGGMGMGAMPGMDMPPWDAWNAQWAMPGMDMGMMPPGMLEPSGAMPGMYDPKVMGMGMGAMPGI